jgi:tetratricopeptide (TPR) repeat protein
LANYDSQINGRLKHLEKKANDKLAIKTAVDLLLTRGQFLGAISDYAKADDLATAYVAAYPDDAAGYLLRAEVHTRLHRFDGAIADLVAAEKIGMVASDGAAIRTTIAQGRGNYEDALRARKQTAEKRPNGLTLGALAALYAERGEFDLAHATFDKAVGELKRGSPIGPAWLMFQWGRAYELEGSMSEARDLYKLAYDRFPRYAEAAGHYAGTLAATGQRPKAIEVLRELITKTDHPEYTGQLAELEAAAGNAEAATKLVETTRAGWERWLTPFPEAFADHAARFYLGPGANPSRAHELAGINTSVRRTPASLTLLIEAALAAEDPEAACNAAGQAMALVNPTKKLHFESWRAFKKCENADMAAKLEKLLGIEGDAVDK